MQKSSLNWDNWIEWDCKYWIFNLAMYRKMLVNFGVCDNWRVVLWLEMGPCTKIKKQKQTLVAKN